MLGFLGRLFRHKKGWREVAEEEMHVPPAERDAEEREYEAHHERVSPDPGPAAVAFPGLADDAPVTTLTTLERLADEKAKGVPDFYDSDEEAPPDPAP